MQVYSTEKSTHRMKISSALTALTYPQQVFTDRVCGLVPHQALLVV